MEKNPATLALSVQECMRGKNILIAGASGFLGKVFLTLLLEKVPEISKIYILMRPKRLRSPRDRFEQMINQSFVFHSLHEKYGQGLSKYIGEKVEMLEGDVSFPDLGVDPAVAQDIYESLDLFVNTAGLVDFNPDVREAMSINVDGTLHCADFVKKCKKAKLVHVSTCFVSGKRNGVIEETVEVNKSPSGAFFDVSAEYAAMKSWIASSTPEAESLETKRQIREMMVEKGMQRSEELGWTNTYTYSKSMAEQLLKLRYTTFSFSILRPAIVESSVKFPFPGWNEGFNTCGPLAYLLSTWFRYLPAKVGNPFDVIPVDQVANGMLLASCALLKGVHQEVYQCASSSDNLLTIDQAANLTAKSHQLYYKRKGRGFWQKWVRPHWNIKCIGENSLALLKAENMKTYCRWLSFGFKKVGAATYAAAFTRYEAKWDRILKVLRIFKPFTHDFSQVYTTKNLTSIEVQEKEFSFNPKAWNWTSYWLDIHMPGLRRWSFPVIRREQVESLSPKYPFAWPRAAEAKVAASKVKVQ